MAEKLDVYDKSGARVGEATENGRDGFAGRTKYRVNDNYGREVGKAVEKPDGWGGTDVDVYDKHGQKVGEAKKQARSSSGTGSSTDWLGTAGFIGTLIFLLAVVEIKTVIWIVRWLWRHPRASAVIGGVVVLLVLLNLVAH